MLLVRILFSSYSWAIICYLSFIRISNCKLTLILTLNIGMFLVLLGVCLFKLLCENMLYTVAAVCNFWTLTTNWFAFLVLVLLIVISKKEAYVILLLWLMCYSMWLVLTINHCLVLKSNLWLYHYGNIESNRLLFSAAKIMNYCDILCVCTVNSCYVYTSTTNRLLV